ncbi:uncharacterized protein LOC142635949 [Castanea sativa]|uniref:uncharacterized protein LOC142635949 n=1 Tax=Castanea sativa TaxID=21020 RepID=UPI003F64D6C2
MLENFVMFDVSPSDDLNVLLDADMNGLCICRKKFFKIKINKIIFEVYYVTRKVK